MKMALTKRAIGVIIKEKMENDYGKRKETE